MSNKLNRGKLQNIYNFQYGKGNTIENIGGDYPIYGSNGIVGYTNKFNSESSPVIGHIGAYAGIVNWAKGKHYVTYNGVICKIKKSADSKFGYYSLLNANVQRFVRGSTQPFVSYDLINEIEIWLPNIETQQKIAAVLCALDNKIELNNQINAELEAMAKTLYDYWFVQFDFPFGSAQGKPFDFAPFDSAQGPVSQNAPEVDERTPLAEQPLPVAERSRTVAERSRGYKSSGGKMVFNEVLKREIPEGWGNMIINDLGSVIGGSTPSKANPQNFCDNGIPWITPKDLSMNIGNKFISNGELDLSALGLKDASLNILPLNSVLMSSRAPIGYLAINRKECTTNQGFKSIVCDKGYGSEYVYYVLKNNMKIIEANASGSTFKEISGSVFKSINIMKPPQKVIVKFVEKVCPMFERQNNLELQNQELAQLRDWLLPMLMNGQVTVGDVEERMGMVAEEKSTYSKKNIQ